MTNLQGFHCPLSLSSSSFLSISNLLMLDVGAEEWKIAEKRVHEILSMIEPTVVSEHRRKEIIEYIQILIGTSYGIKVFPFGSVPLKTYLPDGDIDLTALCHHDEEVLSCTFCSLLQNEENMNADMHVRNVQCVPAQVKVVKCSVEKISVDISFNQMAGLCALSFLDQVDQLIGKDHLFKRSVILIKAWCFYESRVLGANYGLISSYALETMVLHIINLFHSSLHCPLTVLCKFLGYYSKFDWENYCVAIDGLLLISSLPEIVVQTPADSDDMLLSAEFLQNCREAYFHSTGIKQTKQHPFQAKFLNVIDPLRGNNNLGRSVNRANFLRIKAALSYGTKKLGAALVLPLEKITVGIEDFFRTTLGRNGGGKRPDAIPLPELGHGILEVPETIDENKDLLAGIQYGLWSHDYGKYQGHSVRIVEKAKSRGTGTYIPQPMHLSRQNVGQSRRRPDSPHFSKPSSDGEPPNVDGTEFFWSEEDGSSISLMEFPPLPGTKPVEIKVDPSSPYWTSQKATEAFSSPESTAFGTMKTSEELDWEWEPASPILQTLPCSDFLIMDDFPSAEDADEELLQNEEKMILVAKPPILLEDLNEFPALPRLRLGDANEFPPLLGLQKGPAERKRRNKHAEE